ncbi:MbtH-like protein [Pseudomonas granadensis]|nr:MbtH-like protein [Pseudomonas granadensis]
MTSVFDREDILFQVVVNHEEQYSIWPDYKAVPEGWRTVGKSGLKKRMPGLHRGSLDRHAPAEPASENGSAGRCPISCRAKRNPLDL